MHPYPSQGFSHTRNLNLSTSAFVFDLTYFIREIVKNNTKLLSFWDVRGRKGTLRADDSRLEGNPIQEMVELGLNYFIVISYELNSGNKPSNNLRLS